MKPLPLDNPPLLEEMLTQAHIEENKLNIKLGEIDKQIKDLYKDKFQTARRISANMRNRNRLIDALYTIKHSK